MWEGAASKKKVAESLIQNPILILYNRTIQRETKEKKNNKI